MQAFDEYSSSFKQRVAALQRSDSSLRAIQEASADKHRAEQASRQNLADFRSLVRPVEQVAEGQIAEGQIAEGQIAEGQIAEGQIDTYTVLIVESTETDRSTYKHYVVSLSTTHNAISHYAVLEAQSGQEGLTLCETHAPDLILLGYSLPDLNGLEFLRILRSRMLFLPPVIMVTGEGNEKVAVEAMKIGVRDYIVKQDLNAKSFGQAVQRVLSQQALQQLVSRQQRQQQLMASIALRVSKSLDLESILQTAATGMRQLLDCDRTAIYRFESDLSGTILAESVLPGWSVSLDAEIEDTCFQTGGGLDKYLDGHKTVINDIYQADLSPCHIEMLERFEVKANLVVPIVLNDTDTQSSKVWGLLLAHHCRSARTWLHDELTLLDQLAVQMAIAIQQNEFVTALKLRAAALSTANYCLSTTADLLKERNKELDEFAYIASHDLRAPLRAISNLTTWLEEDLADTIPKESRTQLALIRSRTERLSSFINGLLDYSRAGRQSLEVESVDLHALIGEVVETLAPPETISIIWPSEMPVINTYRLLLHQVLSNLISNAIKYHDKEDGKIEITMNVHADQLVFSVIDDGPGIDPAYHEKIFGIFQMLSSRDDVESAGIGLSIVKKIVEKQQGTLSVDSALGKGSKFTFTWMSQP